MGYLILLVVIGLLFGGKKTRVRRGARNAARGRKGFYTNAFARHGRNSRRR